MGEPEARWQADTLGGPSRRLVLFGDTAGLPQLLRVLPPHSVIGLIGASIRPAQHDALTALSSQSGLPLLWQPRPHEPAYSEFKRRLRDLGPDLFIINSYSMILRPDLLDVPRFGAVNVHGALLPDYRGANPTEWALINGERETGITIHVVDSGIDTGPVIGQRTVPIHFEDTWLDVRRRVGAATERLLDDALPAILAGGARLFPQAPGAGRYWRRRSAEDGRFEWSQPAIDIYNLLRALVDPHPGACVGGKTIRHWLPMAEILWRKHQAGADAWSRACWRLVPQRVVAREKRGAGAPLILDLRRRSRTVGHCILTGLAAAKGPVLATLDFAPRLRIAAHESKELRQLVARFTERELKQPVTFS
jgi:methionyl-tRNA formyltransferase